MTREKELESMSRPSLPLEHAAVSPYLIVEDAQAVIDFLAGTFGATSAPALRRADGSIMHVQARIADTVVMLGEMKGVSRPGIVHVYVADVDAVYAKALSSGGTPVQAPVDRVFGDRQAAVDGPQGHQWWIATRVEDVDHAESTRRLVAEAKG